MSKTWIVRRRNRVAAAFGKKKKTWYLFWYSLLKFGLARDVSAEAKKSSGRCRCPKVAHANMTASNLLEATDVFDCLIRFLHNLLSVCSCCTHGRIRQNLFQISLISCRFMLFLDQSWSFAFLSRTYGMGSRCKQKTLSVFCPGQTLC